MNGGAYGRLCNTELSRQRYLIHSQFFGCPTADDAPRLNLMTALSRCHHLLRIHSQQAPYPAYDPVKVISLGLQAVFAVQALPGVLKARRTQNPRRPEMRSSAFWPNPDRRSDFSADHPPALRTRPPPTKSGDPPSAIPFLTNS